MPANGLEGPLQRSTGTLAYCLIHEILNLLAFRTLGWLARCLIIPRNTYVFMALNLNCLDWVSAVHSGSMHGICRDRCVS